MQKNLDGQNRQLPIASVQQTWSTLASHSAVPRGTNVKRVNANRDSNRSTTNAGSVRTNFCVLGERYDRQRTLAIRIAGITLASGSVIIIAQFRLSKQKKLSPVAF